MDHWYLLYTKPKSEDRVCINLNNDGFETLNPKLIERRYVRGAAKDVVCALFPCYVFVRFNLLRDYHRIIYTRGVKRVVGCGRWPLPVDEALIESIRSRMQNGIVPIRPKRFNPGDRVVIHAGPFSGIEAVFEREMKGTERVSVLLDTLNARVSVEGAALSRV